METGATSRRLGRGRRRGFPVLRARADTRNRRMFRGRRDVTACSTCHRRRPGFPYGSWSAVSCLRSASRRSTRSRGMERSLRRCTSGAGAAWAVGVVFAFALPVVWVNGGRAFSDTPATALFLGALACLATAEERRSPTRRGGATWFPPVARRSGSRRGSSRPRASAGPRPHLIPVFFPSFSLPWCGSWPGTTGPTRHGRSACSALAGTAAWFVWLFAEAGGARDSSRRYLQARRISGARADFRDRHRRLAPDLFLVRDFCLVAACARRPRGRHRALAVRGSRRVLDLVLVLVRISPCGSSTARCHVALLRALRARSRPRGGSGARGAPSAGRY